MLCPSCANHDADHEARHCFKAVKQYAKPYFGVTVELPKLFAAQGSSEETEIEFLRQRIKNMKLTD